MEYFQNTKKFIEISKLVHGDIYDYSLVDYISYNKPVKIICKIHGIFEQKPTDHKDKKRGCQKCGQEKSKFNKYSTETFINKSNLIHNYKYDYSLSEYIGIHEKLIIICKKHGEFNQLATHHIRGNGCPVCNESKGELKISSMLSENGIEYSRQHKFENCVNKYKLPFDFYLPKYNYCIEYDGEMHFKEIERFGGKSKIDYYRINDNIKNTFCESNNIKLFRIKFDQNIESEINKIIEYESRSR